MGEECVEDLIPDEELPPLSRWIEIQDHCKRELLPLLEGDQTLEGLFWHQYQQYILFGVIGDINAGKTTFISNCMNGKLLPELGKENTCVPVFIHTGTEGTRLFNQNREEIHGNVRDILEEANNQCRENSGTTEEHFILEVPSFEGLTRNQIEMSDKIGFIDIGGMNTRNTELYNHFYNLFVEKSDGVIFLVTASDIRDKRFHEMMEKMDFLTHRPDILPENIFIVVNYLEECTSGSMAYESLLETEPPFSTSQCVKLLEDLTDEIIDDYTTTNPQFKDKFSKERRIIVGLQDAKRGLLRNDPELIIKSNWPQLQSAILPTLNPNAYGSLKKRVFSENMISLCQTILERVLNEILSLENEKEDLLLQIQSLLDQKENFQGHQMFLEQTTLLEIAKKLEQSKQRVFDQCPLQNIASSMSDESKVQQQVDSYVEGCRIALQLEELQISTIFTKTEMDERSWAFSYSEIQDSAIQIPVEDFNINFSAKASSASRQIRSSEHCGKHWHGGAKRCHKYFSWYDTGDKDKTTFMDTIVIPRFSTLEENFKSFVETWKQVITKKAIEPRTGQINRLEEQIQEIHQSLQFLEGKKASVLSSFEVVTSFKNSL